MPKPLRPIHLRLLALVLSERNRVRADYMSAAFGTMPPYAEWRRIQARWATLPAVRISPDCCGGEPAARQRRLRALRRLHRLGLLVLSVVPGGRCEASLTAEGESLASELLALRQAASIAPEERNTP